MKVCVTGSEGFIGSFLCSLLLEKGYEVVGIDNYSKYGHVVRPHNSHPRFRFAELDLTKSLLPVIEGLDFIIANAAVIGGIALFHKRAYSLLADNERIMANTFDSAIQHKQKGSLRRVMVMSSSMVFENTKQYPTKESDLLEIPSSTYGMQKLMCEFWAKGAWEQHGVPYTICRPFNAVGIGEEDALGEEEILSGNVKLMMSHVLPDLVNKTLKGQDPLHILGEGNQIRCYTHGKDIARGIVMAMENPKAENNDFNISTSRATSVLELGELVWKTVHGNSKPFRYKSDEPFKYDVQKRVPDVTKARDILGFEAQVSLEDSVREVVDWMKKRMNQVDRHDLSAQ
jgi:UDP-glucose 4-epimerase